MLIEQYGCHFRDVIYLGKSCRECRILIKIISNFLQKVMNVCRYKTLFVAFLGGGGGGGLFSQLHEE